MRSKAESPIFSDRNWEKMFEALAEFKKQIGHCHPPPNWPDRSLLKWLQIQKSNPQRLSIEQVRRLYDIGFDFGKRESRWLHRFFELCQFRDKYGHCTVPTNYSENLSLGAWVASQRINKSRCSPARMRWLNAIGFSWAPIVAHREQRFQELVAFKEKYGHVNVPFQWPENKKLGGWVSRLRHRQARLSPDLKRKLSLLGFEWGRPARRRAESRRVSISHAARYEQRLQELVEFKERYGHVNVPAKWLENMKLSSWVSQRRYRKDRLSPEVKSRLDMLGFEWSRKREITHWEVRYRELKEFYERFGHAQVPIHWEENPKLATWVMLLRRRKERLAADQVRLLDALQFAWTPKLSAWEREFQQLKDYKSRFGNCNPPPRPPGSRRLCLWVRWHRKNKKSLPVDRIERLNALGFEWHPYPSIWERRYQELKEFHKEYGHCRVPWRWKPNPELSRWIRMLRWKRAKIPAERKKRLDEIGFEWEMREVAWLERLDELVEYRRKHGHCDLKSQSEGSLGRWAYTVRQLHLNGKLVPERIEQLTALGFCWDAKAIK